VPDSARNQLARFAWLPFAALLVHILEEFPHFPEWATARFGTTTTLWYGLSHFPLVALAALISWRAARPAPSHSAVWWLLVLQAALLTNAIFHVSCSVLWREYSPGVLTAVVLYAPLSGFLVPRLVAALGRPSALRAAATGAFLAATLTGTLALDIPVG